jgi:hypothetical protein
MAGSRFVATSTELEQTEVAQHAVGLDSGADLSSEDLLVVVDGLHVTGVLLGDPAEGDQGVARTGGVVELPVEIQGLPEMSGRLVVASQVQRRGAQLGQRPSLAADVTEVDRGSVRRGVDGQRVGQMRAGLQVDENRRSEEDGLPEQTVLGGVDNGPYQVRSLRVQPLQAVRGTSEPGPRLPRGRAEDGAATPGRIPG